ncbi:hypothetical protein C3L33_17282, partial [Rhododendron williamsianum]
MFSSMKCSSLPEVEKVFYLNEQRRRKLLKYGLVLLSYLNFCFLPYYWCFQNKSNGQYTGDGSVDINGQPVLKSKTGNWRACPFILGSHYFQLLLPRQISVGTMFFYFRGMCTLTISATVPALKPAACVDSMCPAATPSQYMVFFFGLYLIALGTGGIKPCVSSFGADQFDNTDPKERVKKGSFFNWFYFSINLGALISSSLIVWIQENAGWGLGFGIPALFMGIAIASFFSGTSLYRFQNPQGSPLTRMCQVLVASFRKRNLEVPTDSSLLYEEPDKTSAMEGSRKLDHTDELT